MAQHSFEIDNPFMLRAILLRMDIDDVYNICAVSAEFRRSCGDSSFWREYYEIQSMAEAPSAVDLYIADFKHKKAHAAKWKNSKLLLRDIGMPDINLEDYLQAHVYPSWLAEVQAKTAGKPVKSYSVFDSFGQMAESYEGRSKLEAGLKYLTETGFDGLYGPIYDAFEVSPDMTLGDAIRYLEKVIEKDVWVIQ